jgi:hypothetical protein
MPLHPFKHTYRLYTIYFQLYTSMYMVGPTRIRLKNLPHLCKHSDGHLPKNTCPPSSRYGMSEGVIEEQLNCSRSQSAAHAWSLGDGSAKSTVLGCALLLPIFWITEERAWMLWSAAALGACCMPPREERVGSRSPISMRLTKANSRMCPGRRDNVL